ncbi:hypothetical protein JTB14_003474 [Gonioctena quinquepunctata]|nr:hypothetical protein JTB14_003474 [Gonioctena quinquepunctata]
MLSIEWDKNEVHMRFAISIKTEKIELNYPSRAPMWKSNTGLKKLCSVTTSDFSGAKCNVIIRGGFLGQGKLSDFPEHGFTGNRDS